ncbi:MAG: glycerol-3-phosphate 1-O-acyltransferase PlsY [Terracidiphilus sp.]
MGKRNPAPRGNSGGGPCERIASVCPTAGGKLSLDMVVACLLVIAVGYLLGSIPVGYLLVRLFLKQDVRSIGSGNIGATNVLRSGNKGLGAATFLLDVVKGSSAVYVGALLGIMLAPEAQVRNMQALVALSAVLGHVFTVWLHFKGGKGVATGFGVFLVAAPSSALCAIGVFALVLLLTRYVSLASILGAASFPVFAWFLVQGERPPFFFVVQLVVPLIIIAKHHQNIRRLLDGTESRFGTTSQKQGPA